MDKKRKYIYETMWGNEKFDFPVEKTKVSDSRRSDNSYTFAGAVSADTNACCNRLIELFDISDKDLFRNKFNQACGICKNKKKNTSSSLCVNEAKRIARLHSSALCALLFFYNITENNSLMMTLNGRKCEFTYSTFEFQTPVIKNPSNMDVVLLGKDCISEKPVILFLESKFSEYCENTAKKLNIANEYLNNKYSKEIYGQKLNKLGLTLKLESTKKEFAVESDKSCYLEGIKQMISHFIGVNNFIEFGAVTEDEKINSQKQNADIYLGEILFDSCIGNYEIRKGVTCYQSYKDKYEKLANILADMGTPVNIVSQLFSYNMFKDMNCVKEEKIIKYYFECGI